MTDRNVAMEEWVPRLRKDIEMVPTSYEGQRALLVRESLGLIREPFLLHGEILSFLSLIDGKRNIRDIQLDLIRLKKGAFVTSEEVMKILGDLDSIFLLESDKYLREKEKIIASYSLLPKRVAFHAGRSYPKEREALRTFLNSFFPPEKESHFPFQGRDVAALVVPHIDLNVGKRVYAEAYRSIKDTRPERILLLGTGHSLCDSLFSLTEKDFETPLGTIKTDKDWVKKLRRAGEGIVAADDIAHRSEHSLEFQFLFLQHFFGSRFSLIPVLCGPFQPYLEKVSRPKEIPGMEKFLVALRTCLEEQDATLVVAGVDFSHIGMKFGHDRRASSLKQEARNHDQILLEAICEGHVQKFWEEARRVNNRYNVCGLSCVATLMEIHPQRKGHLLGYELWQEEATQSAVSFAAVAIQR